MVFNGLTMEVMHFNGFINWFLNGTYRDNHNNEDMSRMVLFLMGNGSFIVTELWDMVCL